MQYQRASATDADEGGGQAYPSWYYILKIIAKLQHQEACDGFRSAAPG